MALPSNYVSRSNPQISASQGIYEESTTKQAMIGAKLEVGERVFRYAKAGAGCTAAAKCVCAPLTDASHVGTGVTPVAAAIGALTITGTVATSAITTDQYADGYLCVATGLGLGQMIRIKSHTLGNAGTGLTGVVFTLYDGLTTAITATSLSCLMVNPYNGVLMSAAATGVPVGVTPVAVTSGNYFWLQTKGLAPIRAAAANTTITTVILGTSGAAVSATVTGGDQLRIIGQFPQMAGIASTEQPVFLNLE
jgi:hypothetical protein